ncbi:MAG: magnesium transporter [Hyphomicrobiaceae bacterium]|nr:magnesium transporter [Hyphomicrobiaceae bacterium]
MAEPQLDAVDSTGPGSPDELVARVMAAIELRDDARLGELVGDLRSPDLADIIVALEPDQRAALIEITGKNFDFEALSELPASIRDELTEALPNELLAQAITELDSDDAAYLLDGLEAQDQEEVLAQLTTADRAAVERNLDYPEETAGRVMQAELVAVPPFWTVGRVIDHMRETVDLPETFAEIFVVDPAFRVLGTVDLSRLLRSKREVGIDEIMDTDRHELPADADFEDVKRQFQRYDLISAAVVDENKRLVGVVTVDDVVEMIQEDAEKDIKRMAGVGAEEAVVDGVRAVFPLRFLWLFINLIAALLASLVIKRFDTVIEQMVALAVLMPIVASMGGNAGNQTMTVAVRALATRELTPRNMARFAGREIMVALLNGLAFAGIVGVVAYLWFGTPMLGVVISLALIINLAAAAVAGVTIPILLDRLDYDPAISSTVLVTTVTDVVGFLSFLGLASLLLM